MINRKPAKPRKPFNHNEYIEVYYELEYAGGKIVLDDKMKFKNRRGTYKFKMYAINPIKSVDWITAVDCDTGEWRSFRKEDWKVPKRTRKKK